MTDNLKVTRPKTLKDIVMLKMTRFMIRQEAIKWIKHELKMIDQGDDETALMSGFMEFFNITKRDLE